jgi:hypothetical protein
MSDTRTGNTSERPPAPPSLAEAAPCLLRPSQRARRGGGTGGYAVAVTSAVRNRRP